MTNRKKDNVILLPKTVDYYQIELTRILETERYQEAMQLLRFLLQCQSDDQRLHEEWQALLDWLQTMAPGEIHAEEEKEETESELFRQHLKTKTDEDSNYTENLLDMLLHHTSLEKQMLALEQLAYIDHPKINQTLQHWIETARLHPIAQFKVLQILKARGVKGRISIHKQGAVIQVEIEDTPLSDYDFPPHIGEIMNRIQEISEVNNPALFYFAEQTWNELLAFIYGTAVYHQLLALDKKEMNVWAAALHLVLLESMFDTANEKETKGLYGITEEMSVSWERAIQVMKSFSQSAFFVKS